MPSVEIPHMLKVPHLSFSSTIRIQQVPSNLKNHSAPKYTTKLYLRREMYVTIDSGIHRQDSGGEGKHGQEWHDRIITTQRRTLSCSHRTATQKHSVLLQLLQLRWSPGAQKSSGRCLSLYQGGDIKFGVKDENSRPGYSEGIRRPVFQNELIDDIVNYRMILPQLRRWLSKAKHYS